MEVAPDLHFRHCPLGEVQLPAESFVQVAGLSLGDVCICCDVDAHVFNPDHTDPRIAAALRRTHWIDVRELGRVSA